MRKRIATWVTLATGLLAILSTISAALYLAHRQSVGEESMAASAMTRELLRRTDAMGEEALVAYHQLDQTHLVNPCSDTGLALMRDIGMKSDFLQAVGYVHDQRLQCSSFGRYDGKGLPLGPVGYVSSLGTRVRLSVDLGQGMDRSFLVFELGHYAAAIHASTMLDVFTDKPDISLGIYGMKSAFPLAVRGTFDPAWTKRLGKNDAVVFFDGHYLVAIQRSRKFDMAAYSAVPTAQLNKRLQQISMLLLPLGLLLGIGLSLAVFLFARRQNSLPAMLRLALKRREFVLHYQPIVALDSGRMVGAEALLRWPRDEGRIRPDLFIPAAEDSGLIGQFTDYVLDQVASDAPAFLVRHPDCYISINLASTDLHGDRIVESLKRLVATPGVAPANLMVEMTEHSFLDADLAGRAVKAIRALGIRVAIDDFGTGFSSLSHLAKLKTDCLKIDKVFVDAIGADAVTSEVALHIIHMAESLGLTVIGEGIETQAQAHFLCEYGVQYGQGWLYSQAVPMAELLTGARHR
ncbi:MAG: EAL domain-containing protein [Thermomonas sp.]